MKPNTCLRHFLLFTVAGCLLAFSSCEKFGSETYTISGKAQKGPFVAGSIVTINELNKSLGQTGKSFSTTLISADGSFELSQIELASSLALLTANGFYFSEIYGKSSGAPLSLQAMADLDGKESVNINVLNHLIKDRIRQLVSDGLSFGKAQDQATSELLEFLGAGEDMHVNFEDLDISQEEEYHAVLLAVSIMLQRFTNVYGEETGLTAELTELLSNLSSDLSDDGQINDRTLVDTLLFNISCLNLIDIRRMVEEKYQTIDPRAVIPQFEESLAKFQEKHSRILYSEMYFPERASNAPALFPDIKVPNILAPGDSIFKSGKSHTIAAICPLRSNLTIKIIGNNQPCNEPECGDPLNYFVVDPDVLSGWIGIDKKPNGYELHSQRQNALMVAHTFFYGKDGSARIEFYKDDAEIPFHTKRIRWEYP